jgi:lysophospholipase L1-like esterase
MPMGIKLGLGLTPSEGVSFKNTKTVVILGSSNGSGYGASTYVSDPVGPTWGSPSTSWAGLLKAGLQAADASWQVINRSVSGTATADSLARFDTDVTPHRPSHVILCTHVKNEGFNTVTFLANMRLLIAKCLAIGARPILRGGYMADTPTAQNYADMLQLNKDLGALGWHVIDNMSTLDDGTGKFISSGTYDIDGLHPNDAGYQVFYDSIDLGLFLGNAPYGPQVARPSGAWRIPAAVTSGYAALVLGTTKGLAKPLKSFTVAFRLKGLGDGLTTAKGFLSVADASFANLWRLRNPSTFLQLTENAGVVDLITSSYSPQSDTTPRNIVCTYNRPTNAVKLYIDGSLVGSASFGSPADVYNIVFGSRELVGNAPNIATSYTFQDMAVWAVPLSAAAVAALHAGTNRSPASMVFDGLTDPVPPAYGGVVGNAVRNTVAPTVGITWEQVADI